MTLEAAKLAAMSAIPLDRELAIDPRSLPSLRDGSFLRPRSLGPDAKSFSPPPPPFSLQGSVAVVTASGPLLQTAFDCGWFSIDGYDAVLSRMQSAIADPRVSAVVMAIDSPGGECAGLFDCVRQLRAMSAASKKPFVAVANEWMTSAAYALACSCAQILCPDTGSLGSIGVIQGRADWSAANAQDGYLVTMIASGKRKTDYNGNVPLTDDARAAIQSSVDQLAGIFAADVSGARGISAKTVLGFEAGIFAGADAVANKLADAVGNVASAIAVATSLAGKNSKSIGRAGATQQTKQKQEPRMETVLRALGLKDSATEAEALAAVQKLASFHAMAAQSTGLEGDEILGALEGLKAKAARCDELESERAEIKKTEKKRERADLVAKGEAAGQLTPAMVANWVPKLGNKQLRGFLKTAPVIEALVTKERKEPKHEGTTSAPSVDVGNKKWSELSSMEKHNLAVTNLALANVLRAQAGLGPLDPIPHAKH